MIKALTAKYVESLKPFPERREIPDLGCTGLYITVHPTGRKSWAFRYRFEKKTRRLVLGSFPLVSLSEARQTATAARDKLALGQDPGASKQALTGQATVAEEPYTFERALEEYFKRHLSKLKSGKDTHASMLLHAQPVWGQKPLSGIQRSDVTRLLDNLVAQGKLTTANRVRVHLSGLFNWALERDKVAASPVTATKVPVKETARERALTDDEVRWLWLAAEVEGHPWKQLFQLLLLTGQRRAEVSRMSFSEINGNLWTLPPDRTKNGKAHRVYLADDALALINSTKGQGSKYVITTTGSSPVSGFSKGLKRIRDQMQRQADKEVGGRAYIPHWTIHDIRRTVATGMAKYGVPVWVTEAMLNHTSGSTSGIVSVYQRYTYEKEANEALRNWSELLRSIVERRPMPLPERGTDNA